MKPVINNELIRSFGSCYDPNEIGIDDKESLSIVDWVNKYRTKVKNQANVVWLLCRKEFMSDKDLRLFAVWCARESFKLKETIDQRSIDAVNVAERYANGQASDAELAAAWSAARSAAWSAAARSAQVDKLLTYFKTEEPAFPTEVGFVGNQMQESFQTGNCTAHYSGMSARLSLAGMAMQGLLANTNVNMILAGNNGMQVPEEIAKYALQFADELIKQEEETRQ